MSRTGTRTRPPFGTIGAICGILLGLSACGCGKTEDSLGYNDSSDAGGALRPLSGPASYPNAFRDVLGKSDDEIRTKIDEAFTRLFRGDPNVDPPSSTLIYYPVGTDQAYIQDTLHQDVRTEGIGYGMMITVELDKRDEFDRLWKYAKSILQITSGSTRGYFNSSCDLENGPDRCVDPFGLQQFVMALLLARGRWGDTGPHNYTTDVQALFALMRHPGEQDSGTLAGIPESFDPATKLVYDFPTDTTKNSTRPAVEMPAYYELWARATGDPFWIDAAASARSYWKVAANPNTGLMPVRAQFTGTPTASWDTYRPEGYRTQINVVLDQIWVGEEAWETDENTRLLDFFASQGMDTYGTEYSLDGQTCIVTAHEASLVVVNGVSALGAVSSQPQRASFIQAVWDWTLPAGDARYYGGILHMVALLILSGQFRVY